MNKKQSLKGTPAVRLGLEVKVVDDSVFQKYWKIRETGNKHISTDAVADSLVSQAAGQTWQYYLTGNWNESANWCAKVVECTEYYFGGDFRNEPSDYFDWVANVEQGLGWGSVGGYWEQMANLLTYPFEALSPDSAGKCEREFYVGLGKWWNDHSEIEWISDLKKIRGAGSKYYHLLGDAVQAIVEENNDALNKNLEKCIKQYFKSERGDYEFPMAAVFLRNLAECEGLKVSVPEDIDKYLFHHPKKG